MPSTPKNITSIPSSKVPLIYADGTMTKEWYRFFYNLSTAGGVGVLDLTGYTVATLAPAGKMGRIAFVTDAFSPAFEQPVVGGGSIKSVVFDNGSNWVVI